MKRYLSTLFLVCLLFSFLLTGCASDEEKAEIEAFTQAAQQLEALNESLDNAIAEADLLVQANEVAFDETAIGTLETTISTAKSSKVDIPEQPKELDIIRSETEKLNSVDYTTVLQQLSDAKKAYEDSVKQLKQITAPSESFVIERLQLVKDITGISAITEENDPNGKLGKQGGYTAQVYFSYSLVDQESVIGNSIIEKGTDCGGSIEVYSTVEDAEQRDSYLASFDSGILSSGSHKVIGTLVVRTSDELTASQQKELENNLIDSLIKLEE